MFFTRALTVLIALPVFAGALFLLPQWLWALFLLPILFIGAWEWAGLGAYRSASRIAYAVFVIAAAIVVAYFSGGRYDAATRPDVWLYGASMVFWIAVAPAWLRGHWAVRNPVAIGAAGFVALVPLWLALVRLQEDAWMLLLFMSVIWIADTFAYLAGKQFGRHKLAPRVSPGKSWEGVAGAAIALVVYWLLLWPLTAAGERFFPAIWGVVLFAALLPLSIVGDLFESWLKRQAGVKDSGQLLPGHGGILDRIDGLTSTMPLAALVLQMH